MGEDENTLKERINQFVWVNASGDLTLNQAEEIAVEIHSLLRPELWGQAASEAPVREDLPYPANEPFAADIVNSFYAGKAEAEQGDVPGPPDPPRPKDRTEIG